jgi:hypothetical protein
VDVLAQQRLGREPELLARHGPVRPEEALQRAQVLQRIVEAFRDGRLQDLRLVGELEARGRVSARVDVRGDPERERDEDRRDQEVRPADGPAPEGTPSANDGR